MNHQTRIKSISVWFYIIALFQGVTAYLAWSNGSGGVLSAATMGFAAVDILIGVLFVVLGYFAGQKHAWAFVAGFVLYALRAVLQFFEGFSPIALAIRAFLLFRIFQGWQACVALNQAEAATKLLTTQRRLEMPQNP